MKIKINCYSNAYPYMYFYIKYKKNIFYKYNEGTVKILLCIRPMVIKYTFLKDINNKELNKIYNKIFKYISDEKSKNR